MQTHMATQAEEDTEEGGQGRGDQGSYAPPRPVDVGAHVSRSGDSPAGTSRRTEGRGPGAHREHGSGSVGGIDSRGLGRHAAYSSSLGSSSRGREDEEGGWLEGREGGGGRRGGGVERQGGQGEGVEPSLKVPGMMQVWGGWVGVFIRGCVGVHTWVFIRGCSYVGVFICGCVGGWGFLCVKGLSVLIAA